MEETKWQVDGQVLAKIENIQTKYKFPFVNDWIALSFLGKPKLFVSPAHPWL